MMKSKTAKIFSLKEIASQYGRPYSTTRNHIIKLQKKRLFRKESLGVYFTEKEYIELLNLLGVAPTQTQKRVPLKWLPGNEDLK
jgi:hypothetical protein